MASFKETLRKMLLNYPGLHPDPLSACCQMFCTLGGGFDWNRGQLIGTFHRYEDTMYYGDLDKRQAMLGDPLTIDPDRRHLNMARKLTLTRERAMREWVESNIDDILNADCTLSFGSVQRMFVSEDIAVGLAPALHFPNDIKPDWARALGIFLEWWMKHLRETWGLSEDTDNAFRNWTVEQKQAYNAILAAQEKLWPINHNGESYATFRQRRKTVLSNILGLLANES